MSKKRLLINIVSNVISLIVNVGISFLLTPYLVNNIGKEAYGFFPLANNFINYINIILSSLNSMAGMFISTKIYKEDYKGASIYFSSTLIANAALAIICTILSIVFVIFIEHILHVPQDIIVDVKVLFLSIFMSNVVVLINVVFSVSTFVKNRLDLSAIRDIIVHIIRALMLILLFGFLKPSISYLGITNLISMLIILMTNIYFTRKLLPDIKPSIKNYKFKAIIDIMSSGIWNTINKLSNTLLDGIDLIIANLFINSSAMGTLAIAKMVPNFINTFITTVSAVFMPKFVEFYAKDNNEALVYNIKVAIKILGIFSTIPVSILIIYGKEFFSLWVPYENATVLQSLSILTIGGLFVSGCISALSNVFTATNNIKVPSIVLFSTSVLSTISVFIILKTTNLGIYAIAGVSTIFNIIRNLTFVPIYATKCIDKKWNIFYPEILKSMFSLIAITVVFTFIKGNKIINSWIGLAFYIGISFSIGIIINIMIVLNKEEQEIFKKIIKQKINFRPKIGLKLTE